MKRRKMSKLPGKWKDVPIDKIINWLGHPANVIDHNDETFLDRCKRVKDLNHFVQPLMDNGGLTSTAVRTMWDLIKEHYTREEQESMWADFWKEWEKNNHMKKEKERIRTRYNRLRDIMKKNKITNTTKKTNKIQNDINNSKLHRITIYTKILGICLKY